MAIAALAVANFWYWMVLPMPTQDDSGLNGQNLWQWVGSLSLLAFVAASSNDARRWQQLSLLLECRLPLSRTTSSGTLTALSH